MDCEYFMAETCGAQARCASPNGWLAAAPLSFCLLPRRGEEALPPLSQCRSLFKVTHPNPKFRARVLDPEDILAELWLGVGSSLVVGHFKI